MAGRFGAYRAAVRTAGPRLVELIGWVAVTVAGLVMLSQAFGWDGFRTMAVVQSLTPYLALAMAPLAVLALVRRRVGLALTAAAIGMGGLALAWPILVVADRPAAAAGADGIRIASVNLYYGNGQIDEVASDLLALDVDVIVFVEYTAEHQRALRASDLGDEFEYQIGRSGPFAEGAAVWSRTPVLAGDHPDTTNHSLDVTVESDDGPIRVLALHTPTPIHDFDGWLDDLRLAGRSGLDGDAPTAIVGDFNASFWHPSFRELLDEGYTDAHIANGRGLSVSWPMGGILPAFVRLDHALTTDGLVATDVEDFDIAGSDHRGFVVTVAPTG